MLIFGAIFAVSALGGYFFREEKVYQPAVRNIERRVHEESQNAIQESRKPLTGVIRHVLKYDPNQVGRISKMVDINVYYYSNGIKHEEVKTFNVPITQDNIENELTFIGQGNQNKDWRRGDVTIIFQKMNWAEEAKKKITDKITLCFPNMSEEEIDQRAEVFTNNLYTYGTFTMPNPNNPGEPFVFRRDEMV